MAQKILILNTGGTFASVSYDSGLAPGIGSEEILKELSSLRKDISLELEEFCALDSANFFPKDQAALAARISEARKTFDGIVVIHGTDTLAYTSSMLSFMLLHIDIPVVITGSQLSLSDPVADAMENCRLAFHMALSGHPGVFVAFNRKVILGCRASKVRSLSFDAFDSVNYPVIAHLSSLGMPVDAGLLPEKKDIFECRNAFCDRVLRLVLYPGMPSSLLTSAPENGIRGVFIEAFGLGGMPFLTDDMISAVKKLVDKDIAVLVGSQCLYEGSNLNVYETGKKALAAGVMEAHDMTGEAAVTKLMWVLGQTDRMDRVREYFRVSLCREVTIPKE